MNLSKEKSQHLKQVHCRKLLRDCEYCRFKDIPGLYLGPNWHKVGTIWTMDNNKGKSLLYFVGDLELFACSINLQRKTNQCYLYSEFPLDWDINYVFTQTFNSTDHDSIYIENVIVPFVGSHWVKTRPMDII